MSVHSSGQPAPHGPGLQPMLQLLPVGQVGSHRAFWRQRHRSGQPEPQGFPPHSRSHSGIELQAGMQWFRRQIMSLHSSGQPAPHGPGLQPTLQALPIGQEGSHKAFVGQTTLHRSGQPAPQMSPPHRTSHCGPAWQLGLQKFPGQTKRSHS